MDFIIAFGLVGFIRLLHKRAADGIRKFIKKESFKMCGFFKSQNTRFAKKSKKNCIYYVLYRIISSYSSGISCGFFFGAKFSRNPKYNSPTVSNHMILMANQYYRFLNLILVVKLDGEPFC